MIVHDEPLLAYFRQSPRCELCSKFIDRAEVHHVFGKGVGGGTRLDVPENLVAVGSHEDVNKRRRDNQQPCRCHVYFHDGMIPRHCVLAVVALREQKTVAEITDFLMWLRTTDKRTTMEQVEAKRLELQRRKAG